LKIWPCFAVLDDFDAWWIVLACGVGRVTWDWDWNRNANGQTKTNKYCDYSNTEVLAVPIALTLKVKMKCIANYVEEVL
jgi:hypothetical protein